MLYASLVIRELDKPHLKKKKIRKTDSLLGGSVSELPTGMKDPGAQETKKRKAPWRGRHWAAILKR